MDKGRIKDFFDKRAPQWDEQNTQNAEVLSKILDNAQITEGLHVLDVACGTGVLFPYYMMRNVASVTGIDISYEMTKIAKEKFPEIEIICQDAETYASDRCFDRIMVYNALPHFPDSQVLIENLIHHLAPGGIISVAHGMGREELNRYHQNHAEPVSRELMEIEELERKLAPHARIVMAVSNADMYQLVGIRHEK